MTVLSHFLSKEQIEDASKAIGVDSSRPDFLSWLTWRRDGRAGNGEPDPIDPEVARIALALKAVSCDFSRQQKERSISKIESPQKLFEVLQRRTKPGSYTIGFLTIRNELISSVTLSADLGLFPHHKEILTKAIAANASLIVIIERLDARTGSSIGEVESIRSTLATLFDVLQTMNINMMEYMIISGNGEVYESMRSTHSDLIWHP